jgi:outer membrane biosynthesis protein TonB
MLAGQAGIDGTAVLELIVGIDGKVEKTEIIESRITPDIEKSLLNAAKELIYRLGKRRLKPVRCRVTHLFKFSLFGDAVKIRSWTP